MLPELYHAQHNRHLEDLPFWLDLAAQSGDPILELGCGTGRVLNPLAQAGHACVGLDRELGMLYLLRASLDPHIRFNPALICADISQFSVAELFSLIILPCNTISTLNEVECRACLECVGRHLRAGGRFAASMPNPDLIERLPAQSAPEFEEELVNPRTGNPVQVSSAWRRTKRTFTVTWIYDLLHPDGTSERLTVDAVHYRRSVQAYLEDFKAAGLTVENMFGDFDRSAFSEDSPSLIILAAA